MFMAKLTLPKQAGLYEVATAAGKVKLTFQPVTQRWYLDGLEVGTGDQVTLPGKPETITAIVDPSAAKPAAG